jgi:hypothetical protein
MSTEEAVHLVAVVLPARVDRREAAEITLPTHVGVVLIADDDTLFTAEALALLALRLSDRPAELIGASDYVATLFDGMRRAWQAAAA